MKRLIYLSFVSALVLGACGESVTEVKKDNKQVDSTAIAIAEVTKLLESSPENAELLIRRAKLYQDHGQYMAGYNDALKAVSIDSLKASYWLEVGKTAFAVENYFRSEEAYKKCIALDEKSPDCMIKLSEFYLLRRNYQGSVDYANKALQLDVNLARPYFIKGWIYMETGDTAKAATSYQTAVELDPNFYDAYMMLGTLSSKAKREVAVDYFNSAIAVRPNSIEAYYNKAMFLQSRGKYEEAITTYKEINVVDSTYPEAYYNIGFIKLTYENQPDSAIEYFSKAIAKNRSYFQAYYNRGYCQELLGKKVQAAADYKLSLGINNNFELAREGLKRVQ